MCVRVGGGGGGGGGCGVVVVVCVVWCVCARVWTDGTDDFCPLSECVIACACACAQRGASVCLMWTLSLLAAVAVLPMIPLIPIGVTDDPAVTDDLAVTAVLCIVAAPLRVAQMALGWVVVVVVCGGGWVVLWCRLVRSLQLLHGMAVGGRLVISASVQVDVWETAVQHAYVLYKLEDAVYGLMDCAMGRHEVLADMCSQRRPGCSVPVVAGRAALGVARSLLAERGPFCCALA